MDWRCGACRCRSVSFLGRRGVRRRSSRSRALFSGFVIRDRWLFHSFANACNSGQRYASYVLLAIHLLSLSFHVSVCFRFMFQCSVLDSISAVSLWRLVSLGSRMLRLL